MLTPGIERLEDRTLLSAIAVDDQGSGFVNDYVFGDVLLNDYYITAELAITTQPSHGSVTLDGFGQYTYVPDVDFVGIDSFKYQLTDNYDGNVTADQATVTIEIITYPTPEYVGTIDIETAYQNQFGVGDGSLVSATGGTFTYATGVPFRVMGQVDEVTNSPLNAPAELHVWSANQGEPGAIDLYFKIAPGTSFDELIAVPIGTNTSVTLYAELINPYTDAAFCGDDGTEGVTSFDMMLKELLAELDAQTAKDGADQGADSIVESMAGSLFTPEVISGYENQYDLSNAKVLARIDQFKTLAKSKLKELSGNAIDNLFNSEEPHWIIKTGAGDPGKGAAESFWGNIKAGVGAGVSEVLDGRALIDAIGDFVTINWGDAGAIFGDPEVQSGISHLMETGNTGPLGNALEDKVIIDSLSVNIPIQFPDESEFNGAVGASVTNISFDHIGGLGFQANVGLDNPKTFGAWQVNIFSFGASYNFSFQTNKPEWGAGLNILITEP